MREVPTAAHPEFSPLCYILGIILDVRGTNHARSYALFCDLDKFGRASATSFPCCKNHNWPAVAEKLPNTVSSYLVNC